MASAVSYGATSPLTVAFHAGSAGEWQVVRQSTRIGEDLPAAERIGTAPTLAPALWTLTGFTSNLRYTTGAERLKLDARSAPLGRSEARMAALIPIRKSAAWWAMAQDERRAIYERSAHTPIGLGYLPGIARRLHHCRDLGEPFDFLTWFEFEPELEGEFDDLLARLRITEEWRFIDREIDIRLIRADCAAAPAG
ncbi:chlorite dismutase [Blastomonas natatoria]|uniref:Chlorite dismutase n=1 Tax=Blastomonas natatoria TaxID=34015 RepID=A0A2V3UZ74_9SPHN|nr:chlorite dismutase family protein [Blastomonas natatoria]PXW73295.1 chlorite dismutase [Blastomonas natatoria]